MSVLNSSVIRLIPLRHSSRKLQILLQLEHREHDWAVGSPSAAYSECPRIRFSHGDRLFRLIFLSSWSRISNDQSDTSFPINYPITIMPFDAMHSELMTDVIGDTTQYNLLLLVATLGRLNLPSNMLKRLSAREDFTDYWQVVIFILYVYNVILLFL